MKLMLGWGYLRRTISLMVALAMVLGMFPTIGVAEEPMAAEGDEPVAVVQSQENRTTPEGEEVVQVQTGDDVEPKDGIALQSQGEDSELTTQNVPTVDNVKYIDADSSQKTKGGVNQLGEIIPSELGEPGETTWYVTSAVEASCTHPLEIMGDVHLVLADSTTINCTKGIMVTAGSSLTVYAQSKEGVGLGKLNTSYSGLSDFPFGITTTGGAVTINGGTVTAEGLHSTYPGIYVGPGETESPSQVLGGSLTVSGGAVTTAGIMAIGKRVEKI